MMQARKSACIFYGNRVRYNYFLYSLIHMTAGGFLSSDTDSVESIFHRTVVKKSARMQRGEGVKDEKGYDVVRFIEHGGKCRPAMDYVRGQTLIGRLQTERKIPKKLLFQWFRMLCTQLDCYHRSKGMQCYRYLSPYSVIVTREDKLLLLDLSVPGNGFVMKKMQIPAVRAHFVMPAGKKRSGMAVVWSRQIVSVYAGIYECGSAAYLEGGVYDVIGDPKMYRGKWKENIPGI